MQLKWLVKALKRKKRKSGPRPCGREKKVLRPHDISECGSTEESGTE
jgi:hypothetical protein